MVFNNLFNQRLMDKYAKKYRKEYKLTHSKKEIIAKWVDKLEKDELKDEMANYGLFSRLILEGLCGYDYEKNIEENVKEQYGHGFSEFALKKGMQKFMVIEIKGQNVKLDKKQGRKGDNRSSVDQAFDYSKNSGEIDWIFVSNYQEFRLYNWHKKKHQYIMFKAEELKKPEVFAQFMLTFSQHSIEHDLIGKLLTKKVFMERDFEKEFYKLYHETRLMLIAELEHQHPHYTREESVHYAQLILNRYIFICFAEDLNLLPEEITIKAIENPIKNHDIRDNEIWHRLNSMFHDINKGNPYKKVYGYNGGLFEENIEKLMIRDMVDDQDIFKGTYTRHKFKEQAQLIEERLHPYGSVINPVYRNLLMISSFNFQTEVDINILGHIFENSIGEIEELQKNKKGRRKKEGIYYTPTNITDYICHNTIIPYLSKSGQATTIKELIGEYYGRKELETLYQKVENIKILDPACGSGAFLNQASDLLLEIHQQIHQQIYKEDTTLKPFFDPIEEKRKILLNNLFGVDLNEESVEITKLSLFLKVCKTGLKLPNLDTNIKKGNSIIEDTQYTNKPFKWKREFPEIMGNGGFDIVIGNPPYIRQERIKKIKTYLKDNYNVYTGVADLYVYFFELGLKILKKGGYLGFITSNKFTRARYGKPLRQYLTENRLIKYTDYTGKGVFEDATVDPCIIIIQKKDHTNKNNLLINDKFTLPQEKLTEDGWVLEKPEVIDLKEKIQTKGIKIKDIPDLNIYYGISTGYDKAFIIDEKTKKELLSKDPRSIEIIKPILRGRDIKKWQSNHQKQYIISCYHNIPISDYPFIKDYLKVFKKDLENRAQVVRGDHVWYELDNNPPLYVFNRFENPKLIYPNLATGLYATIDEDKYFVNAKCYMVISDNKDYNIKYIAILLSSKALNFFFKLIGSPLARTSTRTNEKPRYDLHKFSVEKLPIYPANPEQQEHFIEKADIMLQLNKIYLNEVKGFKEWLQNTFQIDKFSKKLDKYYELTFTEFLVELEKKKIDIQARKTQELLEKEFKNSLNIINPLLQEINTTDKEIDQMVYKLYKLTPEEIEIIENTT